MSTHLGAPSLPYRHSCQTPPPHPTPARHTATTPRRVSASPHPPPRPACNALARPVAQQLTPADLTRPLASRSAPRSSSSSTASVWPPDAAAMSAVNPFCEALCHQQPQPSRHATGDAFRSPAASDAAPIATAAHGQLLAPARGPTRRQQPRLVGQRRRTGCNARRDNERSRLRRFYSRPARPRPAACWPRRCSRLLPPPKARRPLHPLA